MTRIFRPAVSFLLSALVCGAAVVAAVPAPALKKPTQPAPDAASGHDAELEKLLADGEEFLFEGDYERAARIFQFAALKAPGDVR
ncbi:MAG TPA: hypothetical protein V6D08_11485, partial [Candidatus Obscuribacterales bacterium]